MQMLHSRPLSPQPTCVKLWAFSLNSYITLYPFTLFSHGYPTAIPAQSPSLINCKLRVSNPSIVSILQAFRVNRPPSLYLLQHLHHDSNRTDNAHPTPFSTAPEPMPYSTRYLPFPSLLPRTQVASYQASQNDLFPFQFNMSLPSCSFVCASRRPRLLGAPCEGHGS